MAVKPNLHLSPVTRNADTPYNSSSTHVNCWGGPVALAGRSDRMCAIAMHRRTWLCVLSLLAGVQLRAVALRSLTPANKQKSTRLNSSHGSISYAVFCLKKKKEIK